MKANAAQDSQDWMQARAGKFTASRAADLMARTKTGPGAARANLIATLVAERITGQAVEGYRNAAMDRGIELEGEARDAYSFNTGQAVVETGFIVCGWLPNTGCSPDGLVGDDGLVEIKCPSAMAKHLDAILTGAHADEYRWQLQHQLMVTGREWVDAYSYDPRWPENLQQAIRRVTRDEEAINQLSEEIRKADAEVEAKVAELQNKEQQ
ncbi:exonuclease [Stenotrophomonas pavanii]|uniref:Exonuclease n=1 Tax=Stenotrophomonas pavanii TaxID=487698 RepID=A0A246L3F6_9GAMM|nr:lambda exonuclease family protein [Stenotrophomonas pavanii]OWR35524.1 exonuclease [Stenotrophomonas pavanii]